jgi:sulfite reductase alpha subunit-like flavoprotein
MYRKELEEFVNEGALSHIFVAFSREGPEKVYVQDLIAANASLVWEMLNPNGRNGYFYVCGDAKRMARDVHDALADVTAQCSNCSRDTALHVLDTMMEKNHYMKDVY